MGLSRRHGYSITGVREVQLKGCGKLYMIRLWNPWGPDAEWKGPWSNEYEHLHILDVFIIEYLKNIYLVGQLNGVVCPARRNNPLDSLSTLRASSGCHFRIFPINLPTWRLSVWQPIIHPVELSLSYAATGLRNRRQVEIQLTRVTQIEVALKFHPKRS